MNDKLKTIAERLRTQDNRGTAEPAFCVQVLERIGPIIPEYSGARMYHDHRDCETYYQDRNPEEWQRLKALDDAGELPDHISAAGYVEKWVTAQTCFTEEGCKEYLEQDGHNLRHYFGVRIYAESFRRNSEMIAIREALNVLGGDWETFQRGATVEEIVTGERATVIGCRGDSLWVRWPHGIRAVEVKAKDFREVDEKEL
jgi:hypothetical protein